VGCTAEGEHIAHHDPARVLRQAAAYRRILDEHRPSKEAVEWDDGAKPVAWVDVCGCCQAVIGNVPLPCPTIRALASIYSDREGYDPSWTVE